jgi:hypothetical protein
VSFAAITLRVASQRVFFVVVISLSTQSGNFWIHPRTLTQSKNPEERDRLGNLVVDGRVSDD